MNPLIPFIVLSSIIIIGMMFAPIERVNFAYLLVGGGQFVIAFLSGLFGMWKARSFGKSAIGKSLVAFSIGVWSWGIGALLWLYFNMNGVEVPYPSLADVGFFVYYPFMLTGIMFLLRTFRPRDIRKISASVVVLLIVAILGLSWLFLDIVQSNAPLFEKQLSITYLLLDVIIISFAVSMLEYIRGGAIFLPLGLILLGFIFQGIADIGFTYTTLKEIYYTGNFADVLYTVSLFLMGVGFLHIEQLKTVAKQKLPRRTS